MMIRSVRVAIAAAFTNLLLISLASAATFHVREGATGTNDGSSWTNAWSSTSSINYSAVNPGDTIYLAGGTYGVLNIGKAGTSGSPITVKRATKAEHGSATGWTDAYDARVIIDGKDNHGAVSMKSFNTLDGATRYGIWIRNAFHGIIPGDSGNNLTIRHVEIGSADPAYKMDEDGIQGRGSNLLLENSYIHDNDSPTTHGDGIQWYSGQNIVIRYNVFENNGQIFMFSETAWGNEYINDLYVYYNVFRNRAGDHYQGISTVLCPQSGYGWYIYNNTFDLGVNPTLSNWKDDIFGGAGQCAAMKFVNNAILNSRAGTVSNVTHHHNGFDNAAPYATLSIPSGETGAVIAADLGFNAPDSSDYHLKSGSPLIGKGANVGLVRDFEGKAVPSTPTIGAFEAGSSTTAPTLAAPTNLSVQ